MDFTMETLLMEAKEKGASDLHITVGVPPKCRINGILYDMDYKKLLPEETEQLIFPILSDKFKTTLEKKGEVDFAYSIPNVGRYRVNVFKQRGSFAGVIRVVGTRIPSVQELGIPESVVELTKKKRGLVLVTGPTGSGKSTSLASLLDVINQNYSSHVITLEDPIEYLHNHAKAIVNQREVGLDTISYANALRAALREDPDVILVGEMRDLDTISTAITAAETGHLVFSTLHTIGAAATIDRIIDVFPPHQQQQIRIQLASVLESVISQQLIPMTEGKGRIAAYEVMNATPAIKNLIRESKTHQITSIIQTSRKAGMQMMDDAIYDLYLQRKIDAEQALEYAQDPAALERKLY
ncbi:type IV pilus twitching motility protein PilT [Velocimicrobium porci]|uniref:Type IV pilus twitching motility protein PilT n=1 Tax=Velocimicrobium porci TaxID=2606634 RepID=A0A6L5XXV1_9FIRM|nr:type IV pilus twitching motility protein PilT [Velocimicrobium porci]MSS63108.1 type IV pilus twitching motility protein PilT [Velocimicrobium porci]